ncbi:MSHA biogenesis protein MshG [Thermotomaculum hydrothermale]|uniref:MSHA biogenesis protein MshG n=1 Tax=Thermotomaculum hydrothermale TaxID=981385 RepID=A0A7R6PP66_9BACT|nr:type II secretion system F family protein [Thermotomaculum hydrothermale]BBB32736.1 MSHA biogenesis protein MshG [Thermotomaculum hydrothermale]
MAKFFVKARDEFGNLIENTYEAETEKQLYEKLNSLNYIPIKIQEIKKSGILSLHIFPEKITITEQILFFRQLATLIDAGVPLIQSLEIIRKQLTNEKFEKAIANVKEKIEEGLSLSEAMSLYPDIFTRMQINMVLVAEEGGVLPEILDRIALILENEKETKEKIKTATRYPKLVITALSIAFLILMWFVVPQFQKVYGKFGKKLPLPTRMLFGIYMFLKNYWWLLILIILLLYLLFRKWVNTEKGRRKFDKFKLKIYIFGPLFLKIYLERFTRVLSLMIQSGVPIVQALDIVAGVTNNVVIENAIIQVKNAILEGKTLAEPMEASKYFTDMVVQMVTIGENTGKLDYMLMKVANYYEKEVDYTIKNLSTLIEPILIAGLAVIVLFFALAIYLPMWNMMSLFK